jgi:multicomponent Na+:H+ antiporter subunit B
MFSVYIMFRGHNEPGGGFIGGLIAASAIILHSVAFGAASARETMRVPSMAIAGWGLFLAAISGVFSLVAGKQFLTGLWWIPHLDIEAHLAISTPLLFDIGVYLVVVGAIVTIALEMEDAED